MEFGYAMFRPTTANGSQFNNIKNCAITLNKANINTIGVYLANTDAAGVLLTPGGGSTQVQTSNVISGNTITNCFSGIAILGAPTGTNFDVTNTIGGATAEAGNTISNIGGSDAVLYGIRAESQTSLIVQNNNVTLPAGNTTTNVYGIGIGVAISASLKSTTALPLVISNNTVTIASATTEGVWGIYQAATAGAAVGINCF